LMRVHISDGVVTLFDTQGRVGHAQLEEGREFYSLHGAEIPRATGDSASRPGTPMDIDQTAGSPARLLAPVDAATTSAVVPATGAPGSVAIDARPQHVAADSHRAGTSQLIPHESSDSDAEMLDDDTSTQGRPTAEPSQQHARRKRQRLNEDSAAHEGEPSEQ